MNKHMLMPPREETCNELILTKSKCKMCISSIPTRKAREKFTVTSYDKKLMISKHKSYIDFNVGNYH